MPNDRFWPEAEGLLLNGGAGKRILRRRVLLPPLSTQSRHWGIVFHKPWSGLLFR